MGRKSSVQRLEPAARQFLERLLREDRHTLDELLIAVREQFPAAEISRSAIHRHRVGYEELVKGMREQQAIASLVVAELGENPDEKAGALLVQTVSTLTTQVALAAAGEAEVDVETVRKLARATKDVLHARRVDREERVLIRKAAREELLAEQAAKLEAMPVKGGVTSETKAAIREALGII
ncbi:phage protein Gp27 family protein [Variovorax sp.]|uniref:phage protein Gp27 family protein n=1 Tax=Variovorax sp. TaxID=1871043 RepID=UPI003BA8D95D